MAREPIAFAVDDLSALSRSLKRQLEGAEAPPSHLALMNMLARGAGYRNVQHLRAVARPEAPAPVVDQVLIDRCAGCFDAGGVMLRWPARRPVQELCLWALWARLPAGQSLTEREVNAALTRWHSFGDAALLRRSLWGMGLVSRQPDGSDYRRIEQAPPPEARALLARLRPR